MRPLRLMRVAAEAEGLRLRHRARRAAMRAALLLVATVFLLAALVFAHVGVWYWLRQSWQPHYVALALFSLDIVVSFLLVVLASRSTPDRVELEALAVRQRALEGTASSIAFATMLAQVMRVLRKWMARSRH